MTTLTVAFCTFKRADRLDKLVAALRAQNCPIPFDILAINNNSPDDTLAVLNALQQQSGAELRVVTETAPGIVPARNRALEESLDRDILVFIDDDELPHPGFLAAACDAIVNEGAQCVGGCVEMDFVTHIRPSWLEDDLLGFLAAVDHGSQHFWIKDSSTPIWTANVAYDMRLFRDDPALRFDPRYNREGADVGGGEDAIMLRALLARQARIRYRPDMVVQHSVDAWKLHRRYFLKLHYRAGLRQAQLSAPHFPAGWLGIPPFLLRQFFSRGAKTLALFLARKPGQIRQAMNAAHALGYLQGYRQRSAKRLT
ncbi:MAG TPA: glycosyltransferase [Thiobacillus sp.]|nr:MAG: glycosyltransferase [Hydrogenophilales bacterium 16-61-112]OZA46953.1 MAG: glycosyltransferase [Hydrogenophilales bacterium 17-61-76]HQT30371.1 glycosyltransferase [Thiobacillus sp.]HQT69017.1 glycosyltransferase [Thiobacillus sp.]